MRTICLLLLGLGLLPGSELAVWRAGAGRIDGRPAEIGQPIAVDTLVESATGPCNLRLSGNGAGDLTLARHSALRLRLEDGVLICELVRGMVQSRLPDLGPYSGYRVEGGFSVARVQGTVFVVQRRQRVDHVAVIDGRVNVRLRREVAETLAKGRQEIELLERQRISADSNGLGEVASQKKRPQLARLDGVEGDWQLDAAALLLGLREAAEAGIDLAALQQAAIEKGMMPGKGVIDDLQDDLTKAVIEEVLDTQAIVEEILETSGQTVLDDFPSPPD